MAKRILWGYYYKSRKQVEVKLADDLEFYSGTFAFLHLRHPKVIEKVFSDGQVRYAIEVDDLYSGEREGIWGIQGNEGGYSNANCNAT